MVITIVILIILAVVTINFAFGESGLITKANEAKIMQAVSSVKETINLEALERKMDKEKLTPEIMLAEGKVTRTVQQGEDQSYHMHYALKDNAYEQMAGLGKGNLTELKDIFLIDDNLNIKYISKDGKEYGDNIEEKVLTDETEIKFSSEAFSQYVSKISGIAEDEMKFKWMKKQTSLTIADSNVTSLVDLAFFPNLTSLTLGEYGSNIPQITSMDGVENCTKLNSISIIQGPNKDYTAVGKLKN